MSNIDLSREEAERSNKNKNFRDLKIKKTNQESNNSAFNLNSVDVSKIFDGDAKTWENGFTPNTKIPYGYFDNNNSVQKFANQYPISDTMKSPDYKFIFGNSMYNLASTPNSIK